MRNPYLQVVYKSFLEQIEYKTDFYLRCIYEIAIVIVNLLFYDVIYFQTGELAGWTLAQLRILVLTAALLDGTITFLFVDGLGKIPQLISSGELDFLLIKPLNKRLYISFYKVCASQIISMLIFIIYLFSIFYKEKFKLLDIVLYITFFAISVFILYCLIFSIMCFSFWLIRVDIGVSAFFQLFNFGNKPLKIYPNLMQKIFIYIVPIGIAINYPVEVLKDKFVINNLLLEIFVAIVFYIFSQIIFKAGLKHYTSASG